MRYIGDQEVIRRYIGDTLVWEKYAPPEDFNWEARFNLSFDGAAGDSVQGSNVIRPVATSGIIPNPTPFGRVVDTRGNELPISIQMTGANTRADVNAITGDHGIDAHLFGQRWWNNGNWFVDFTGLDDSKRYQVQLVSYEGDAATGQVVTTITYRRGTNATNLFTISGDAGNPTPASYGFDDVNQIRIDEMQSASGQFRLLIQRNGSVARASLCYLVVREFDIFQDGVQTLRTAGSTDSPLPFVEYVPNGSGLKPAFIFLHGSGERGPGNAASLGNAMRYGPNWQVAMGTFKQDAYAFTPQIPISEDSYWAYKTGELVDFIDWILTNYDVDPARVYLIGFSDGALGMGPYFKNYKNDIKVAAVVLIAGEPRMLEYPEEPPISPADVSYMPMWLFANRNDPNAGTQYAIDSYESIRVEDDSDIRLTIFNDYSHQYPQKVINGTGMGPMVDSNFDPFEQSIYDWLMEHKQEAGKSVTIELQLSGTPTDIRFADLKYNKQAVFQMDWDDNALTASDGLTKFNSLVMDDGTGKSIPWRGTIALMGVSNFTGDEIGNGTGVYITYDMMPDFVEAGWDLANHAMWGTDSGPFNNGGDLVNDLRALNELIMLRVGYPITCIVNPANLTGYSIAGEGLGMIVNTGTANEAADTFPCLPDAGWRPPSDIMTWPAGFVYLMRQFSDTWDSATLADLQPKIDAILADSNDSVHKIVRVGTHNSGPAGWSDFIDYIANADTTGKLWVCSMRELIEFLKVRNQGEISVSGSTITVKVPDGLRWDDFTLIVDGATVLGASSADADDVTFSGNIVNFYRDNIG